ncbi:MAG: translation initiation factor IF-2 [Candidatus Omnitrophota bacterium]
MSIKVSKLAKELGVSDDAILEQLRKFYVDADSPSSEVDDKIAGLVRLKLGVPEPAKKPAKKVAKKPAKAAVAAKTKTKKTEKKEKETKPEEKKTKAKKITEKTEAEPKKKEEEAKPKAEEQKALKEKPKTGALGGIRIVKKAAPEETKAMEEMAKPAIKKVPKVEKVAGPKPPVTQAKKLSPEELVKEAAGKAKPGISKIQRIRKVRPKIRKVKRTVVTSGSGRRVQPVTSAVKPPERKTPQKIKLQVPINIRNLAPSINKKPNEIIQYVMGKGMLVNINQDLEEDAVRDIMTYFGYELELHDTVASMEKELVAEHHDEKKVAIEARAPVVTFMGHVDHGKTSLLDYIRNTMVTKGEKGGITQHIGAYKVDLPGGSVTFLDTPGHAAFTAMRARGAHATDVVVLVVAADDGVMPQTKEAIDHARAAGVPIVVAINKCDLADASPDKVKRELQGEDLTPEDWGGKTVMIEVSAKTGEGIDTLMEMLMLESDMLELRANSKLRARGTVIEGKKTPGQGVVATLLVQNGTLYPGDIVLCGSFFGKVKAMINDRGERVQVAPPATPVEVLGLQGVPEAGEEFFAVKDEKKARTLALLKQGENRKGKMAGSQRVSLEDFHSLVVDGSMKELKIILKADVQGSIGAIAQSLEDLETEEVKVKIIHAAVGNINESDVMLAMVSNGVVIGFHVKIDSKAEEISKDEKVDIHVYDVIYEAIADVKASMEGLLEPEEKEVFQGRAEVREVFQSSKTGKVAGCAVLKGTIHRKDRIRVKRGDEIVFEGGINALRRFKDDVRDVREGFECGISLKGFNNVRKNDIFEAYIIEKVARRLEK